MNKRQAKKQIQKLSKRIRYARKNGETISITHQTVIWKDDTKKGLLDNIDKMYVHDAHVKIIRSDGKKPISWKKWVR